VKAAAPTLAGPAEIERRIRAAIARVPRGSVATYGGIASVAGLPRRARLVGTVLGKAPASAGLPWFRIINATGRISFPEGSAPYRRQRQLLESEGVLFTRGKVDLTRFGWPRRNDLDAELWGMADTHYPGRGARPKMRHAKDRGRWP